MIVPDGCASPDNFSPVTVSYTPPPDEPDWSQSEVAAHEVEFMDVWKQSLWPPTMMPACEWERGLAELASLLNPPSQTGMLHPMTEATDTIGLVHTATTPVTSATCSARLPPKRNAALRDSDDAASPRQTTRMQRDRRSTEASYRRAGFTTFTTLSTRLANLSSQPLLSPDDAAEASNLSAILESRTNGRRKRRDQRGTQCSSDPRTATHKRRKPNTSPLTAAIQQDERKPITFRQQPETAFVVASESHIEPCHTKTGGCRSRVGLP